MIVARDQASVYLTPRPMLWAQELEQANRRMGVPDIWAVIQRQARSRGTSSIGHREWAGHTYIPVDIIERMIGRCQIMLTPALQRMQTTMAARIVAALAAWEATRGIYEFTELASEVISASVVNMPLRQSTFSAMPAHGIYVDLARTDAVRKPPGTPMGFYACMNSSASGEELILVLEREDKLYACAIPLAGCTLDDIASTMLQNYRQKNAWRSGRAIPSLVASHDSILHLAVAALLLCCHSAGTMQEVDDPAAEMGLCRAWRRWRAGAGIDTLIGPDISARMAMMPNPMIVLADWKQRPKQPSLPEVQCFVSSAGQAATHFVTQRLPGG